MTLYADVVTLSTLFFRNLLRGQSGKMYQRCADFVMSKSEYVQFRIRDDIKRELKIVAELRGLSMSSLIHSLVVQAIREEREASPHAFKSVQTVYRNLSFDLDDAIRTIGDPNDIMEAWMTSEGRDYPQDFGVVFFEGWESFSPAKRRKALIDTRTMLDRALQLARPKNNVVARISPPLRNDPRADAQKMIDDVEIKPARKRKTK